MLESIVSFGLLKYHIAFLGSLLEDPLRVLIELADDLARENYLLLVLLLKLSEI